MSERPSKSPYARRRGKTSEGGRNGNTTATSRRRTQRTEADPQQVSVIYQRTDATSESPSQASADVEQSSSVASTVAAQLVPELRGQIIEAVQSIRNSFDSNQESGISSNPNFQNALGTSLNIDALPTPIPSINDELGVHVTQQVREKIVNGEYIDLGILLEKSSTDRANPLVVDSSGQLLLKPKPGKTITDINMWLDAFLVYTSIYVSAHPESIQGLLKYIHSIQLGAGRCQGLGWRDYDQQFRLKKARYPASSWGCIDPELWLLYMQYPTSTPNSLYNTGHQKQGPVTVRAIGKCYEYNNRGRCTHPYCPYAHRCIKCGAPHPAVNCKSGKANFRAYERPYNSNGRTGKPVTNNRFMGTGKNAN